MNDEEINIRSPIARLARTEAAPIFSLDRPIKGMRVGLRNDIMWRSWLQICDVWADLLRKDGAEPVILRVTEHVGEEGQFTKDLVDAWAGSVDCAVVGLAN